MARRLRARAASIALPTILRPTVGVLVEVFAQLVVDELRHVAGNIAVQLALGLAFKLRLGTLTLTTAVQAFAHVVAGEVFFSHL